MKMFTSASIGVLSLLLGVPAVGLAQDEPKPKQEEPRPEPKHQGEAKPAEQNPAEHNKEMKQDENKPPKDEKPSKEASKAARVEAKPQSGQERRTQRSKPAGKTVRIPDHQFREHFGRQHTVVINRPVIVEGQPRFEYAGYWFVIADPWPADWAYADQCYIDDVDGEYFLFDLLHPGVQVAVFVVM
jgi:hypothetical protein